MWEGSSPPPPTPPHPTPLWLSGGRAKRQGGDGGRERVGNEGEGEGGDDRWEPSREREEETILLEKERCRERGVGFLTRMETSQTQT